MENSDPGSLSFHSLNISEIDDEFIINLSSNFPRMKNVDINSRSYYSSSTYNKIFENSDIDVSDSLNTLHMNIRGLETHFSDFLAYLSTFPI